MIKMNSQKIIMFTLIFNLQVDNEDFLYRDTKINNNNKSNSNKN